MPILLVVGGGIGALNGALIAKARFPPVIATLGLFLRYCVGVDLELGAQSGQYVASLGVGCRRVKVGQCQGP